MGVGYWSRVGAVGVGYWSRVGGNGGRILK